MDVKNFIHDRNVIKVWNRRCNHKDCNNKKYGVITLKNYNKFIVCQKHYKQNLKIDILEKHPLKKRLIKNG